MRMYHDVSHFRAPYKNSYVSGFGAVTEPPPVPMPQTPPEPPVGTGDWTETKGGFRYVKPVVRDALSAILALYGATPIGAPKAVTLKPFTPQELQIAQQDEDAQAILMSRSAYHWVQTQEAAGRVVMMSDPMLQALMSNIGSSTIVNLPPGHDQLFGFANNDPALMQSKDNPMGAIILAGKPAMQMTMPGTFSLAQFGLPDWLIPVGIAAAVVGGGYLLLRKKKGVRSPTPRMKTRMGTI